MEKKIGTKIVHHAEALQWLREQPDFSHTSIVTSMPDFTEFPKLSLEEWKSWFMEAAALVLEKCPPDGVVIFYQRDSKFEGHWIDKSFLIMKAAESVQQNLLWRKVVCRVPAGGVTFGKPAYSHLLCFSRGLKANLEKATPDVLLAAGAAPWARGMGTKVCEFICKFILQHTHSKTVLNPFCGYGNLLAVANRMGLDAVGVEWSRKRVEKALALVLKEQLD